MLTVKQLGIENMMGAIEKELENAKHGDYVPAIVDYGYLEALIQGALNAHTKDKSFEVRALLGKDGLHLRGQLKPLRTESK